MRNMARAATMPDLPEDHSAMIMNLSGYRTPGPDLGWRVKAGLERPGTSPFADGDAARHDEAGTRTLRKIARSVGLRRPVRVARARALHRRHDNTVLEPDRPKIIRIEQRRHSTCPFDVIKNGLILVSVDAVNNRLRLDSELRQTRQCRRCLRLPGMMVK